MVAPLFTEGIAFFFELIYRESINFERSTGIPSHQYPYVFGIGPPYIKVKNQCTWIIMSKKD